MKTIPEKIYLQWFDDLSNEPIPDDEMITWCQDQINKNDPEYIRADKLKEKIEAFKNAIVDDRINKYRKRAETAEGLIYDYVMGKTDDQPLHEAVSKALSNI